MKKVFKKLMAVALLSTHALLPCAVHGEKSGGLTSKSETISGVSRNVKKVVFGNGFEYVVKLECSPEMSVYDQRLGKIIYKRTATAVGEFFYNRKNSKDKASRKIIANSLSVTFTYDKQGFVNIAQPNKDIISSRYKFENTKWKLRQNYEIFCTEEQCIVSQISMMYKNSSLSRHLKYIDNSHLDLICSVDGRVSFNSKVY